MPVSIITILRVGEGFGPGHRIALGYDLAGNFGTGINSPVPDPDALATCDSGGRGTRTAGIYEPDSLLTHAGQDLKLIFNVI
jgi:hypothetical protein